MTETEDPRDGALLIQPDGSTSVVDWPVEWHRQRPVMCRVLGCTTVEPVSVASPHGRLSMWLDEDAKLKAHQPNVLATALAHSVRAIRPDDYVAGCALLTAGATAAGVLALPARALRGLEITLPLLAVQYAEG